MNRFEFLGSKLDACTMDETVDYINNKICDGGFLQHVVVNVAKLVHMRSQPDLRQSVNSCDLINIDGMGVVWGAKFLGYQVPERVSGVDLFFELLEMSEQRGYPVFFLGAEPSVVDETERRLKKKFSDLNVAGSHHGYFWDEEQAVVDKIRNSGAKLLFVAITSPLKENFIDRWKNQLGVNFVMGVGGTFDIVAGKTSRAPIWIQKIGMEWFYRLCQEPRRMWRRYLVTNSKFAYLLLAEKFKNNRLVAKFAKEA